MVKYGLILFGLLDLLSFALTYKLGLVRIDYIEIFPLMSIPKIVLIASLIGSGILSIMRRKGALIIYYLQFPLRLVFMIFTFGFLLTVFGSWNSLMIAVSIALELARLGYTILIHFRYFKKQNQ